MLFRSEQRLADALVNIINGTSNSGIRTAMIVTMQAETWECNILGAGPIPVEDALKLVNDPRTDIYAAIQATDGAIMNFGRSRRLASPLQKLALALRDGGTCVKPGCEAPWTRCDADHIVEWDDGGLTDLVNLRLLDGDECHKHRHETGIGITRQPDGTWTVDGGEFPPWPPPTADAEPIVSRPPDRPAGAEPVHPAFQQFLRLLATSIERPDQRPPYPQRQG